MQVGHWEQQQLELQDMYCNQMEVALRPGLICLPLQVRGI